MRRHLPYLAACCLVAALPSLAQEPAAAPAAEFQEAASLRDPFWPVGHTPRPKLPSANPDAPAAGLRAEAPPRTTPWPALPLKGITRTARGTYIAIVDGVGVVEAGDTVSRQHGGWLFRWKIAAVTRDGISVTKLDARRVGD